MQHNLSLAKRQVGQAKVWAVVKANAYGHGLMPALRGFVEADGLSLIEFDNAVRLRDAGWHKPILMLEGCFDCEDWLLANRYRLQTTVHCTQQVKMLEKLLDENLVSWPVDLHLKLNSGMNRLGFIPADFRHVYQRLRALPAVRSITLMTHFANADAPDTPALSVASQEACFARTVVGLTGEHTVANSATRLLQPRLAADWVRPGIMLYGGAPSSEAAAAFGLMPAMRLSSEIIGIQEIGVGGAVGYGSRFIASRPTRIGVVACGYADGYPRSAPDGTPVMVEGVRTPLAGRVSMDMLTVDLSSVPHAHVGSSVELWGAGLPIDEVARAAGTIGYELMCALAPRVRVAIKTDESTR
ncbi:MAG: alanine racemase [Burkholderiaceae bacterium]